jgi:inositol oxygenase
MTSVELAPSDPLAAVPTVPLSQGVHHAAPHTAPSGYRDYVAAADSLVELTYRAMYENQTPEHVANMYDQYSKPRYQARTVWEAMDLLSEIVDESDPDTDLPQIVHAMQTAESLAARMKDVPEFEGKDWLPLVGLIHDLGKIMLQKEYGGLPQWSVVGDIFPVEIPLHPAAVFQHRGYHDVNPGINGSSSLPEPGCGFQRLRMSWSHDEYLARVLERSNTLLPPEAIYMVRFHSFYPWHTPQKQWNVEEDGRPYAEYADDTDRAMLPYLQLLQKADLYSKTRNLPERKMYDELVAKYIPHPLLF